MMITVQEENGEGDKWSVSRSPGRGRMIGSVTRSLGGRDEGSGGGRIDQPVAKEIQ